MITISGASLSGGYSLQNEVVPAAPAPTAVYDLDAANYAAVPTTGSTVAGTGTADKMNNSNAALQPVYYQMRLYNKALSGSEITQNYNAIRSTYGI